MDPRCKNAGCVVVENLLRSRHDINACSPPIDATYTVLVFIAGTADPTPREYAQCRARRCVFV